MRTNEAGCGLGVASEAVTQAEIRRRVMHKQDWDDDCDAILIKLYHRGHPIAEIGKLLYRTTESVQSRLHKVRHLGVLDPKIRLEAAKSPPSFEESDALVPKPEPVVIMPVEIDDFPETDPEPEEDDDPADDFRLDPPPPDRLLVALRKSGKHFPTYAPSKIDYARVTRSTPLHHGRSFIGAYGGIDTTDDTTNSARRERYARQRESQA